MTFPASRPPPDEPAINSLIQMMQDTDISSSIDLGEYIDAAMIKEAFAIFAKDLTLLMENASGSAVLVQTLMKMLFENLARSIRKPFRSAIETFKNEIFSLKGDHQQEVSLLKEKYQQDISLLNEKYQQEMSLLREKHQLEVSLLKENHQQTISRLNGQHQQEISQLKVQHPQEILLLKDHHQQEILRLKDEHKHETDAMNTEQHRLLMDGKGGKDWNDGIPVSVNRNETWTKVLEDKLTTRDVTFPMVPVDSCIPEDKFKDLVDFKYADEAAMYPNIFHCLKEHLTTERTNTYPGSMVWPTYPKKSLEGRSPDFTITIQGVASVDEASVIGIWEVKHRSLSKDSYGQLYDYLRLLSKRQPHRQSFVGVLSNLKENVVVILQMEHGMRPKTIIYKTHSLSLVLAYLRTFILPDVSYHPPAPAFPIELGIMQKRLGNPELSVVGAFIIPKDLENERFCCGKEIMTGAQGGDGKIQMVVKRTLPATGTRGERSVKNEIEILRQLLGNDGHPNLPKMLYNTMDMRELAITPHGYPIKPRDRSMKWSQILTDVLAALQWLHGKHIIHRDVRWDNIIWDANHAVLIDLGAAIEFDPVSTSEEEVLYEGGYICCPRELIGRLDEPYFPRPADDCFAFVQLVNMLVWPERWEGHRSPDVAKEGSSLARMLKEFWKKMAKSTIWGEYVRAAEGADYEKLGGIVGFCVYI